MESPVKLRFEEREIRKLEKREESGTSEGGGIEVIEAEAGSGKTEDQVEVESSVREYSIPLFIPSPLLVTIAPFYSSSPLSIRIPNSRITTLIPPIPLNRNFRTPFSIQFFFILNRTCPSRIAQLAPFSSARGR